MRTIIAGSRSFDCGSQDHFWPSMSCTKCRKMIMRIGEIVEMSGIDVTRVISGGARGIDKLGEMWASSQKIPVSTVVPEWSKYGKAAGPKRNRRMITDELAEALIAIWDGASRGTADMIEAATAAGLIVYVHNTSKKQAGSRSKQGDTQRRSKNG